MSAPAAERGGFFARGPLRVRGPRGADAVSVRDAAVVDIGSNSVRLVIYRVEGRAITAVCNEREDAGLGRGASERGALSPEGVERALCALDRFEAILEARGVRDVIAVATAAVREANDREAFLRAAEKRLGSKPRVLTGAEEGYYAALGVAAGFCAAKGVAADLGGSSLELACVDGAAAEHGVTLPAGPLAVGADVSDRKAARKRIEAALGEVDLSPYVGTDTLYAVGGAWRNLAHYHIMRTGHPIEVLHAYELEADDARALCAEVARNGVDTNVAAGRVSRKRIPNLPFAAVVLDRLIATLKVERVRVSAFGVREGLLFEKMDDAEREGDALLAGASALARRAGADPALGPALEAFIAPIRPAFGVAFDPLRDAALAAAACRLADMSNWRNPDHRARLTFDDVAVAPFAGVRHLERAFLARAASARYGGKRGFDEARPEMGLLSDPQRAAAHRLGLALRFACAFSARTPKLLETAAMAIDDARLCLRLRAEARHLLDEPAAKRLEQLASACELSPDVEYL